MSISATTNHPAMVHEILNATAFQSLEQMLFSWVDYFVFIVMLALSALIGIYFGFFGKKQDNTAEYLMGGKSMNILPIAMSLIASHLSGITILGIPAEIYNFGSQYWMCVLTAMISCYVVAELYLPVFYKLQLTSSYEYLALRFDTNCRVLASFIYALSMLLYMPIVIYIPALAFSQVTGISIHVIAPITCIVCIFYTTIGGLKAVVWTDTLQFAILIGAMLTVLGMGVVAAGGFGAVWEISSRGDRIEFFNMNFDPTIRSTFWGIVLGMSISWMAHLGVSQSSVQRFLSVPTIRDAKLSVLYLALGIMTVKTIVCFLGLLLYSRYFDCDPLQSERIQRADQILPFYVMDIAGHIPGLPGLFIAGVFCAALSTMSSGLNTLAGTIYEDFISPFMPLNTTEKRASDIMKLIVMINGAVCTTLIFVVERLGGIIQLSYSLSGITAGPLVGLFTLGMLFPSANAKGAWWGAITSLMFMSFVVIGGQYHVAKGYTHASKPYSIEGCNFPVALSNFTTIVDHFEEVTTEASDNCVEQAPWLIFRISFYYYTIIGAGILIVSALFISWLTRRKDDEPTHPDFLSPYVYWALPSDYKFKPRDDYKTVMEELQIITYATEKEREALYGMEFSDEYFTKLRLELLNQRSLQFNEESNNNL